MTTTHSRRTVLGLAGAASLSVVLTACAQPRTIESYQPAAGADGSVNGIDLRGLVIVTKGDSTDGTLQGTVVAHRDDSLSSVTGKALTTQLQPGGDLQVQVPSGDLKTDVPLVFKDATVSGDGLVPGLVARLTFTFGSGASTQLDVPVVSDTKADFSPSPSPAA